MNYCIYIISDSTIILYHRALIILHIYFMFAMQTLGYNVLINALSLSFLTAIRLQYYDH